MMITRKSTISGISRTLDIPVNPENYFDWLQGLGSLDELMPYLNFNDRNFILAGITDDEWKGAFENASAE